MRTLLIKYREIWDASQQKWMYANRLNTRIRFLPEQIKYIQKSRGDAFVAGMDGSKYKVRASFETLVGDYRKLCPKDLAIILVVDQATDDFRYNNNIFVPAAEFSLIEERRKYAVFTRNKVEILRVPVRIVPEEIKRRQDSVAEESKFITVRLTTCRLGKVHSIYNTKVRIDMRDTTVFVQNGSYTTDIHFSDGTHVCALAKFDTLVRICRATFYADQIEIHTLKVDSEVSGVPISQGIQFFKGAAPYRELII